ncbi:MAG TPA: gliding motility-associated C-terminal domain-containing protein [Bacteroidia bacterium]|nr:gliding motility-associated C-terminal domain-containing protein [Bacteroidia bacterium]
MKKTLLFFAFALLSFNVKSQTINKNGIHDEAAEKSSNIKFVFDADSLSGFNDAAAWQQAQFSGAPLWEQNMFVARLKRNYIDAKYHVYSAKGSGGGSGNTVQAACTNVDFESGTAAGWTITEGLNTNSATQAGCCPTASTRFSVVTPGFDPIIPALARVPAGGGNFSLLIGDGATITGHAVRASQTFTVTPANSIFIYRYALALEDAGHSCTDQPYFNIAFTDCSNNPIPCSDYNVVPSSASCVGGDPAFTTVTGTNGWSYFWKNWTTKSFDLSAYIGQCVKIEFIASDCAAWGHGGWAYVDCSCQAMTLNLNGIDIPVGQTNNQLCSFGTNTLCAPPGFNSYSWTGPGVTGQTGQCITPTSVGSYSVTLGQAGNACLSPKLYSNFTFVPSQTTTFSFVATPCQNSLSVPFTSTVNLNGGPAVTYNWDFDKNGVIDNNTANPTYTFPAYGTYTTQLQTTNGACVNTLQQVVTIKPTPTVSIANAGPICAGACIPLVGQAYQYTTTVTTNTPSFNASPAAAISSVGTSTTTSTINVSGLSTASLASVCLNISHTFSGDLDIYLVCPSGTTLELSTDNGSSTANAYSSTCFKVAAVTSIASAATPFNAAAGYIPEGGSLSTLNSCTLNGNWKLLVVDDAGGDGGTFNSWSLTFNNSSSTTSTVVANSVSWSPSVSSGGTTLSPTVCPVTSTIYTLTGTAANGCTASNTVNVVVTTTTLSVTSPTICNGSSSPLSAGGASTYTWSPATGLSSINGATVTASPTVTTIYTVTGTTASGCVGTQTTQVTVNPKPSATLSFTNPTCGNNNGVVVINNTSSGGQTISSFASNLGSVSGQTVTGLGASSPVITLTNNFGCTFTVSATLTMSPSPTAITTTTANATCGLNNGSFTFGTPTGGTAPYTYAIGVGPFTATSPVTGQAPGTYSITVKDVNGCLFTKTVTITNIPGPTAITGTTTQASCNTNNGTYNVTGVTGGTAAYTYSVDGVATASLTSGLAAGTHTVLVKDANGCTFSTTFIIGTANGPSSFTVASTNASCGSANGTATVTGVTGGTPTYSFSFDGGAFSTTSTTSGLTAGTHTVVVKDVNSCTITATYVVGSNPPPTASVTSSLNILCNGASTGSLSVTPAGGTAPFTYTLTAPTQTNTTGNFTGLAAGAYNITVKDNAGCTATVSATLTQPTVVTGTTSSIPVNCFGNSTGTVSASGSGGVAPYTYLWPALGNSTLSTVGGVAAGTYSVTIRDANLCPITLAVTVTQPTSLTLTSTVTAATCGNANGSGTVTVAGGTAPYNYNWSNGGLTNVLTFASAGTYSITVTDFNGCVLTRTVSITNIPGPTAITGNTTLAGCNLSNGTYSVTGVTGGTPAYTYSVDGVATAALTSGLSAGTHTVTVKDANGCAFSTTFIIGTANGPTNATIVTSNASCGSANGSATVTAVTGGLAPYQYSFNGGAFGAGTTVGSLPAGTYSVTIRDANSCTLTVNYNVLNNSGPTASVTNSININCFGNSTGSFTVTPSGGTAPFTYTLTTPVQTNGTGVFTGLPAGSYNVTVKDNLGCTTTASVTLTQPTALTLTTTSSPAKCFGAASGTVSASGSGGVAPYTYLWPALGSSTLSTVNNVAAGTYSVTQTDANGCSIVQSVVVTQPTSLTLTSTLTPATCGNANGSGTVTVAGGTPAYSYNWSNGGISSVLTGASAGTYTLNVTDFNGCILTRTVSVTNIPGPTAITGTTTLAGCGLANGTYNVTGVTGGTSAYSFSVDAVSTGSLTGGLIAGTHTVTVSDANGCIFSTTFNVGTAIGPATATVVSNNASCGSANGTATVTSVGGGTAPYQYSFNGGAFAVGNTTSGLIAGTHTVTIQDANSCTLTVNYNVLNNGSPSSAIVSTTNTSCFGGNNGGFTVAGSGGSGAPFTYTLTSPFQSNGIGTFTGLSAGTYSVITKDVAGCTTSTTVVISEPALLTLNATPVAALCFGTATGTINLTGNGGTPTYSYNLNGGAYQTSSTFANQFSGIYSMGIKDANGCTATQTVQVTQPTALAIQVATQNANCTAANGIASATVTGGTPIYTYTWTGGGGASAISNSVVAGTYSVTATDANGCSITSQAIIGLTPGGAATITAQSNITCNGANNGSATASMIGGSAPFTYSWTPGGQTTSTAVGLAPSGYTCEITDFYGCKAIATTTITQPSTLTAIMSSNNVKCYGTATGTVSAAGTGGTIPYTYLWPTIPSTLATVPNVAVGDYTCNITDANGCTITASITVTQPTSITLTSTVTAANCNQANGSATVIASGGAPGAYTYTWSSGSNAATQGSLLAGTYTIQVQDANNCIEVVSATIPNTAGPVISISSQTNVSCFGGTNGIATTSVSGGVSPYIYSWSNGNVGPTAPNLSAQIYTVSVTDQAGCVASTSVTITEPTQLTVSIISSNPKCFGAANGYGIGAALGGTPTYTYSWTGLGGNNPTSNPLIAGNYALTVTDGNGCTATATMALVNPPAMTSSITFTNVSCFGTCNGMAAATSTNAVGIVDYFWVGGVTPLSGQTVSGLCAGTYTMVATDQNTCTASSIITITEPTALTANISSTGSVTCNGGNNGFAVVSAGGGTPTYTYTWSGAASANGNSANANNLPAGTYTVTVLDAQGCSVNANTTILEPTPLATTLTTTNAKCNGVCDGTANIAFSGGAGTTTFLWQPGLQSGNSVNNLCAGGQTVTITSNGACPTVLTFTLTEPALLTAAVTSTNSNCGQPNGKTCATVAGGTSPLSYMWSNAVNTLCNNNIVAGAYTFTVTDANGCTANASGLINDVTGPVISITSQTNVSCFNGTNGAATTTITGGVPSYTVSWSGGQTIQNPTNLNAGLHNVTVVDAAGCIGSASVTITEPTQLVSAIGSFTDVTCFGLSNGGATILTNGGTIPYSYVWTPSAQTSSILANVPANVYTGVVTDANGCITSASITISQPQALIMASSSFSNISCFGGSNGQIITSVQGGSPGYTYSWTPVQSGNSGVLGGLVAGNYGLVVTDSKTCSINANFTIIEPSALTSSYVSLPAKCGVANGSATITIGGGTPGYVCNWNTAPAQQGTVAINMAPGSNWQGVITDANGCSITQTVYVNNAPSPIFSAAVSNQPSCFGMSNGDITLNYTSGTAPYTIVWSNPISQTVTTSALTSSVSGVAQGAYTATLTDSYGCSTSQQIYVGTPQMLNIVPTLGQTICYGTSTQISATGQGGTAPYTYSWTPTAFVGGGPHTVNPTVNSSYQVSVKDANGCANGPVAININVTPELLLVTPSVQTICHSGTALLIPSFSSLGNGSVNTFSYTWTPPVSGNTNSITVVGNAPLSSATTATYGLMVTDGCTIPNAQTVFTVITNPLPTVTFTASSREECAPASITFTPIPSASGSYTYEWKMDGANSDITGDGNPFTYNYAIADTFSVKVLITNTVTGCSNNYSQADYLIINPSPIASFYAVPQVASILDPNIEFVNTSQGATNYLWDFGDPAATNGSNNTTMTNPSHLYTYVGTYNVHLIASTLKGCKDIAELQVEIAPDFALYIPNAFTPDENGKNDIFQPMGVGIDEENYRMDIFDRWGENIFTSNNFRKGWDGSVKGGSKLAPQGVYIYKLQVVDTQGNKHPYVGHVTVIRQNQ